MPVRTCYRRLALTVSLMVLANPFWRATWPSSVFLACAASSPTALSRDQRASRTLVIDQLVALVNNQAITLSDILWHLALDPAAPPGPPDPALHARVLQQLIDLKLLDQEAEKLPAGEAKEEAVDKYLGGLVKQFPSEDVFRARIASVGLTPEVLRERVKHRVEILHFIGFRFRAFVLVAPREVEQYYQSILIPSWRATHKPVQPIEEVRHLIERDIADSKVANEMTAWFEEARRRSEIVIIGELRASACPAFTRLAFGMIDAGCIIRGPSSDRCAQVIPWV